MQRSITQLTYLLWNPPGDSDSEFFLAGRSVDGACQTQADCHVPSFQLTWTGALEAGLH